MDKTPLWSEAIMSNQRQMWTFEMAKGLKDMIGLRTIEESCPLDSSLL